MQIITMAQDCENSECFNCKFKYKNLCVPARYNEDDPAHDVPFRLVSELAKRAERTRDPLTNSSFKAYLGLPNKFQRRLLQYKLGHINCNVSGCKLGKAGCVLNGYLIQLFAIYRLFIFDFIKSTCSGVNFVLSIKFPWFLV